MNLPLMVADRRHILYGHVCCLLLETPAHRTLLLGINALNGNRPGPEGIGDTIFRIRYN